REDLQMSAVRLQCLLQVPKDVCGSSEDGHRCCIFPADILMQGSTANRKGWSGSEGICACRAKVATGFHRIYTSVRLYLVR
ncbi:MAG: hypothetical protein KGZ63_05620, partial [Clostridiales bacterium]|nr:hypothetical protein [Clostridiales bacterium]